MILGNFPQIKSRVFCVAEPRKRVEPSVPSGACPEGTPAREGAFPNVPQDKPPLSHPTRGLRTGRRYSFSRYCTVLTVIPSF